MIKYLFGCISTILFLAQPLLAQDISELRKEDKFRIKEAINIANIYCDSVWSGWGKVPFTILLITDSTEFLVNHNNPTEDFQLLEYDSLLQSDIYFRQREFEKHLLATFPAVNGVPTIVVGTPENTGKSTSAWIITLLHEHFHQYQDFHPDYYNATHELDLHGGDETGMWMLNYPFPYEDDEVNQLYDKMKKALISIFNEEDNFEEKTKTFFTTRKKFNDLLNEKDYKYFSLQVWQEGIARYTELEIAGLLSKYNYEPAQQIKQMEDYISFAELNSELYTKERNLLNGLKLNESHRNCFYPFGAFEGKLLDKLKIEWKHRYFDEMFFLEKYYE